MQRLAWCMGRSKSVQPTVVATLSPNSIATSSAVRVNSDGGIRIQLHVKPGARVSRLTDLSDHTLGVQISAPPRDGEANEEVVRFMAKVLKVKGRQVDLVAGHKSREKVVVVRFEPDALQSVEMVEALLRRQLETE